MKNIHSNPQAEQFDVKNPDQNQVKKSWTNPQVTEISRFSILGSNPSSLKSEADLGSFPS
jgi:hypothetical protein